MRSAYVYLILALVLTAPAALAQEAPKDVVLTATLNTEGGTMLPADQGSVGLLQRINKLRTTASMLHTSAHPDDEHAGMLTYLSRGMGARTAHVTINRGEAGANAIGPELFDALGLIRTEELRLASRYYGQDDQYFTGTLDYGYSKTLDESYRSWDVDLVMADMVRVIRMNRPLVVISRFHNSLRDGHGNHQAVGRLTPEAVAAAGDPDRFPEQITEEGLRPWTTPKLYRGGVRANEPYHVMLDVGQYSPWLGDTYQNFGTYGLSLQRSQTSGRQRMSRGVVPYYYELLNTDTSGEETSFFDGLDTSLPGVFSITGESPPEGGMELLQEAQSLVDEAAADLRVQSPTAVLPGLIRGLEAVRGALALLPPQGDAAFMLRIKERQFIHALQGALGLTCSAVAVPPGTQEATSPWSAPAVLGPIIRNQELRVDVSCRMPAGGTDLEEFAFALHDPSGASIDAWQPSANALPEGAGLQARFDVRVPADAAFNMPYFFRNSVRENHYQYRDLTWRHLSSRPAALHAVVAFEVLGQGVTFQVPVQRREANLPYGYAMRKLQVVPALAVMATPRQRIIIPEASGNTFRITVEVLSNAIGDLSGTLELQLPEGWTSAPESHLLTFSQAGQRQSYAFQVDVPSLGSETHVVRAVATAMGEEFTVGYDEIRHSHIETRYLYHDAEVGIAGLEVDVAPDLNVGYVMGVGDDVPSGIEQLGASVTLLSTADLAGSDLSVYDVIMVGTRAYAVRQDLHTFNRRLLDYAHGGGNLIVLYQTQEFVPNDMAPFPAMLPRGAEEVTEQDSPITLLMPDAPVFTSPNPITDQDFDGWVEQRGSKFFTEWADAYTPLIETQDTGQDPQRGILLTAPYGDGHYTYCALAFHRQLPYAVAGAYRLFANLISLGQE